MLKAEQREADDGGTGVFDGVQTSRGTKPWLLTASVSRNSLPAQQPLRFRRRKKTMPGGCGPKENSSSTQHCDLHRSLRTAGPLENHFFTGQMFFS